MITRLRLAWEKIKALGSGSTLDRDFDEELASHLDLAVEDAQARGIDPTDARREALRRLGGLQGAKELHRDTRGLPLFDALIQDLAYAVRTLRRTPAFTLVVVASLALGIGANTAVFTIINAVILRTLPVPDPSALVKLSAEPVLSFAMYRDLRTRQQVFTDILASTREWPVRLTIPGSGGSTTLDNVPTVFASTNYFEVLMVKPRIGRFFVEQDDRPFTAESEGSVAIISDGLWARMFARDPDVLGRVIQVNNAACRVIGVAPPGFAGESVGVVADVWVPVMAFSPREYLDARGGQFTMSIARLKPGVGVAQAQSAMSLLYRELRVAEWNAYPSTRRGTTLEEASISVTPAATGFDNGLRHRFATPLWIIMAVVAAVLLIACANVANLLLARAAWRRGELSLRLALGCGRGRLVRQLLTESVLLALMGMVAGLALAYWGTRMLAVMAEARMLDLSPDATVLAFVIGTTLLTGIAFGISPALRSARADLAGTMTHAGRTGTGPDVRRRLSRTLVLVQVALSLMLLIGAGLLVRTIYNLGQVDLGFRPERVLMFTMSHNARRDASPAAIAATAKTMHDRLRQVPGIDSVSLSTIPLFSDTDLYMPLKVPGYPSDPDNPTFARYNAVSPGYLETLGMTLLEGRSLGDQDSGEQIVTVINQAMARKYFPQGDAVGRTIEMGSARMRGKPIQIVGVVADAKYNDVRAETTPMLFIPIQQFPGRVRAIEVRTSMPSEVAIAAVRQAVLESGKDLMILNVRPMADQVDRTFLAERLIGRLGVTFGVIALILATIGLYGVLSYGVAQRSHEIGIRIALGATRADVIALVLRQSLAVVSGGVVLGIVLAIGGTKFVARFLYGLTATDATTIAIATVALLGAAAIAAYVPARRAARVDPVVSLRHQ